MAVHMVVAAAAVFLALAAVVLHQAAVAAAVAAVGVHLEPLHQADQAKIRSSIKLIKLVACINISHINTYTLQSLICQTFKGNYHEP